MPWYGWLLLAVLAGRSFVAIMDIGEERQPLTRGVVVAILLVNGLYAWAIVALAHH